MGGKGFAKIRWCFTKEAEEPGYSVGLPLVVASSKIGQLIFKHTGALQAGGQRSNLSQSWLAF